MSARQCVAEFWVPGRPVPWKAPQVRIKGGKPVVELVVSYLAWKRHVRRVSKLYTEKPVDFPVAIKLDFFMKQTAERQPDLTNLVKSTEDGLKGTLIRDDILVRSQENAVHRVLAEGSEGVMIRCWRSDHADDCNPVSRSPKPCFKKLEEFAATCLC